MSLDVHANPGHIENGRLLMDWPSQSSFQSPQTGIDKVAVVRAAVASNRTVAFAGDGPPDLPAALLVPGSLRFARGFLAEELQARGKPFQPFDRWSEIAHLLCDPGLLEQLGVGENRPVP